ncbi:hypothetical protein LZC95_50340 [Pendulispora brunnea]|uniref:Uncharacterized protein n=1 Tax=Pendulispora brunnea TaxID=2905690 RepID=A0ABZ2K7E4_9BACT
MSNWATMTREQLNLFGLEVLSGVKWALTQVKTLDGTRRPCIDFKFPAGTSRRLVRAGLHCIAAAVELASPSHAGWGVLINEYHGHGRVYLELEGDTEIEIEQGVACLREAVER